MSEPCRDFSAESTPSLIWSQLSVERRRQVVLLLVQLACKVVAIPIKETDKEVRHAVTSQPS
jgi:hypothetical protein